MLKKIAIAVAVLIVVPLAALLAYAATKPDDFRVTRSARIDAPSEKIFPLIDDFHRWPSWSPYEVKDSAMKRTLSGATSGKGAIYEWNGDSNVGTGRMEILQSSPASKVVIKLDFIKPFEGHNVAEFTLEPTGSATDVTWAMHGPTPFIGKVMHTIFDMDKMVGTDFAIGLANLKALTEK
jgi:hypothetical protein